MDSLDKVSHICTERFDIYYSSVFALQALQLAAYADDVLSKMESILGIQASWKRLPVLVAGRSSYLNAYYTAYPSDRISINLVDAGAQGGLSSFDDELKYVFIHELSHALTLGSASPLWSILGWLLGDYVIPSAWISPKMLSEGTSVWMESMDWSDREVSSARMPGRLHDPSALKDVYIDQFLGLDPAPWEVSGLEEYPGSGGLPYLYGGLFVDYLAQRFGPETIGLLWKESSKGNLARGFDGTLFSRGVFEKVYSLPLRAVWDDFLKTLGSNPSPCDEGLEHLRGETLQNDNPIDPILFEGRIGPFSSHKDILYFIDLERRGLYTLSPGQHVSLQKLFATDSLVEDIESRPQENTLIIRWRRSTASGRLAATDYVYEPAKETLSFLGTRNEPSSGEAEKNALESASLPFLYTPRLDEADGILYGLVRIGTAVLPAKLNSKGSMDVLVSPLEAVSSISSPVYGFSSDGGRAFALQVSLPASPPRLAFLEEAPKGWTLWIQKKASAGGAENPVFLNKGQVVYKSQNGVGKQALRQLALDEKSLAKDYTPVEASWIPLEQYREQENSTTKSGTQGSVAQASQIKILPDRLFPRIWENSRYPYGDLNSLGLQFEGMDLTERLQWTTSAGWHFGASMPEASMAIQLASDAHVVGLDAQDNYVDQGDSRPFARILGLGIHYDTTLHFLPFQRRLTMSTTISAAGIDRLPSFGNYLAPGLEYSSLGARLKLGYSNEYALPFPPSDIQGFQAVLGTEYETMPGIAQSFSLSANLGYSLGRPGLRLSIYGAVSLSEALSFSTYGRRFTSGGLNYPSALAAPYSDYEEYAALSSLSPWYGFSELSLRLFSFEPWRLIGLVRMPWLPSWTLGRLGMRGGLRAAALMENQTPVFPSSAFLSLDLELAVLAGLAAEGRLRLSIEAAYAFDTRLSGGKALFFGFALGMGI